MSSRFPISIVFLLLAVLFLSYNSIYVLTQTETALVTQFGEPISVENKPGLKFKKPFIQNVEYFDKRLLEYSMPEEIEINASDEKRIRLGAFLRWRIIDPLAFARATRTAGIGGNRVSVMNLQISNLLGSSLRQVIGRYPLNSLLSPEREKIMLEIRSLVTKQASNTKDDEIASAEQSDKNNMGKSKSGFGIEIVDVRIVKADLPQENSEAIFKRMQTERKREATTYRAKGDEESQRIKANAERERTILLAEAQKQSEILRGEGDGEASRIFATAFGKDPEFFDFYRSMQSYSRSINQKDTSFVLSPDDKFLKHFGNLEKH
ncbi:MAG: protease modulator HflC [Pseudomonadota bacterium]